MPKGKVDPEAVQFPALAGQFLVIEEKVDGTGVSIFFDEKLELQVWHRGSPALAKEFKQLNNWANLHKDELFDLLEDRYILFGEWMLNKHTVFYDTLPDYFLESDIYDRKGNIWLSTIARNGILTRHEYIRQVPVITFFKPTSLNQITDMVGKSFYRSDNWLESLQLKVKNQGLELETVLSETDQSNLSEGLYIKHEDERRVVERYKYVRYEFLEKILNSGTHLIDREPIHNGLVGGFDY
jgi:RNA ligase